MFPASCLILIALAMSVTLTLGVLTAPCPGDTLPEVCPANCSCCLTGNISLAVDCHSRKHVAGIETSLAAIFKAWPSLTSLGVRRSRVTNITALGLCSLRHLTELNVSQNSLTGLGGGHLGCLGTLRILTADSNYIMEITDNTFLGLEQLESLSLESNVIENIAPAALTKFKVITSINLKNNKLQSVDVWPLYLATLTPGYIEIQLEDNRISTFTNYLNWTYTYGMPSPNADIQLKGNLLRYLSPELQGWSFKSTIAILILFKMDTLRIDVRKNRLQCDCVDFDVYKFIRQTRKSKILNELFCDGPPDLFDEPIIRLALSKFVCHVADNCTGCDCVEIPANATFRMDCQGRHMQSLPETLPSRTKGNYHYKFKHQLLFGNNDLEEISSRSYLRTAHYGDFSHNAISSLDDVTLGELTAMSVIRLDHNQLTDLPESVQTIDFNNVRELTLHNNKWKCDCEHRWFKAWLQNMTGKIPSVEAILCDSPDTRKGRSVLDVPDEEFCSDPMKRLTILLSTGLASLALVFIVPLCVVYCLRVWIYHKLKWHPFNWDECSGENKHFDVFVSFAHEDDVWTRNLIREMEGQGYRTLFHTRDFIAGRPITENVGLAVDRSKRTLCVLSPYFAASDACMWGFTTALNIDLQENKHRLITILKEPIPVDEQPTSLRDYLRHFTYIESDNRHFMDNLLYALPVKRIGPQPHLCEAAANTATQDIENTGRGRPLEDEQNSVDQFEPDNGDCVPLAP